MPEEGREEWGVLYPADGKDPCPAGGVVPFARKDIGKKWFIKHLAATGGVVVHRTVSPWQEV